MAINSKVAAAKKAVKPKSKKTWADNQNPPQSKSYKSAADALVKAKPVGWRWTEAGAARLVKKTSVKPSTADIEKYKDKVFTKGGVEHRYLYSEARADKSDNSQKTKLKTGGRTKLVIPQNQNPPQSKSYKEETDKTVAAKPVGWRWTSYGAHKLGKNDEVKPSADDIEQYKNKTFKLRGVSVRYLYPERRIDKSDTSRRKKFADGGKIEATDVVVDKNVTKAKIREFVDYCYSYYGKKGFWADSLKGGYTKAEVQEAVMQYLKNLGEQRTWGEGDTVDRERVLELLLPEGDSFAAGGQAAPQSGSYQEARDKQVHAKPIGYRFTDARARRLGESPYEKPTAEQIEKYKDKGVYWENRKDKSDRNYTRKFEEGGIYSSDDTWIVTFENQDSGEFEEVTVRANSKANAIANAEDESGLSGDWQYYSAKKSMAHGGYMAAGGQSAPQSGSYQEARDKQVHAKPIGYRFTDKRAARLGESPYEKPTAEQIEKYKDKGVYWENRKDKSDRNYTRKFEEGGMEDEFTSSEFRPVHELAQDEFLNVLYVQVTVNEDDNENGEGEEVNSYSFPEYKGKYYTGNGILKFLEVELGLSGNIKDYIIMDNTIRYDMLTDADGIEATESEIESWRKGELKLYNSHWNIGFSAVTIRTLTEEELSDITGIGVYRVGGVTQSAPQSQSYTEEADKMYKAKPVGWRFKTRFARRKGIDPYRKPTLEEIEKWKDKGVYYEIRFDKSDKNLKRKFAAGGDLSSNEEIKFYDVVDFIEELEYDGDPTDKRLHLADRFNWGADNKKEYQQVEEEIDNIEYKGKGWNVYATYDVSGFQYWMKQMSEQNYITISVRFSKDEIEKSELQKLKTALRNAISDAQDIVYKYDYDPQDKSDRNYTRKFEEGGMGDEEYARGGQAAPQSGSYQEARDKQVHAKPIGYRFTDARARRLGESPYEKPTAEQIEKYKDKGVYWENRKDKSDRNYTRKFEEGGMEDEEYARGGSPKIANRDSKGYTENRYDFRGTNLEGKTLTNGDYVVLSYGYFPIWFYSNATGKWYGNANGFSQTTKVQISQSRPTYNAEMLQKGDLENVMHRSSLGTLYEEEKVNDNEPNV